ncbi:MAG: VOC family protein [Pseudonocardia sp.]
MPLAHPRLDAAELGREPLVDLRSEPGNDDVSTSRSRNYRERASRGPGRGEIIGCRVQLRKPRLFFQRVSEPKTAKYRVHLDLQVDAEHAAAEVDRLVALGATVA